MRFNEAEIEAKRHLYEETLTQTYLQHGPIVNNRVDTVRTPDGKECVRQVVEHPGGVVILPILEDGRILLIEQWRYPLGRTLIEVPAGKLDPGEHADPLKAAQRELLEETGYAADTWEPMHYIYTSPGFCDEKLYLYKATGLRKVAGQYGDEDEFIDVLTLTPEEAIAMVRTGAIVDAKTVCLLFHCFFDSASAS